MELPSSGRGLCLITRMLQNSFGHLVRSGLTSFFSFTSTRLVYGYIYIYIDVFAYNVRVQCYTISFCTCFLQVNSDPITAEIQLEEPGILGLSLATRVLIAESLNH